MKKLLTILAGLLLVASVEAQMVKSSVTYSVTASGGSGGSYTDQFQAVLDDFTWSYGTDTLGWMNDMVYSLDSAGYWDDHMELFYVFTVNQTADANINWVNPGTYNLTDPGSTTPTLVKYQGYDADNADYLSTGYVPSTNAVNISQNNVTLGAWVLTDWAGGGGASDVPIGGKGSASAILSIFPCNPAPNLAAYINATGRSEFTAPASTVGLSMVTRTATSTVEGYKDGSSQGSDTESSSALPDGALWVLAHNNNGTIQYAVDGIVSIVFVCESVGDTDATNIYNIIHRFMTRMGQ